jgi:hypothetical protein
VRIGAIALQVRQRFGHGLRTAYYRDVVRSRILEAPPVSDTNDDSCEIHALTSEQDWLNLVWGLKSFYLFSGRHYSLAVHDDGSLSPSALSGLQSQFPSARVIRRSDADRDVFQSLDGYPLSRDFRRTNHLALKVFDFAHYLRAPRMLVLDSDVLFFGEPRSLVQRIDDPGYTRNSVNRDVASAYTVDADLVRAQTGVALAERFNSGLGLIHRESMRLDWIEEFLALPGIIGHFWRIEQTLYALCSSRFGLELLPSEYDVDVAPGLSGQPCRHYVGTVRHRLYDEGIRHLVAGGFLHNTAQLALI